MSEFVLAVDGGNSKTEAAVATGDGEVVGYARGGNTDIYTMAPDAAIAELARLCRAALEPARAPAASAFSLAGADWPEDFDYLERELRDRLGLGHAPLIVNDALGAMRSGTPDWVGIVVACGTFNAVGARNSDGRVFHLGFWPDRTGGYDLAQEALKAVYRDGLSLGPSTKLTPRLLELLDCDDPLALMHAFTRRGNALAFAAHDRVAPVLLDVADAGDAVAHAIVTQAGTWLGDEARVSADRVGLDVAGARVVLTGGVFRHASTLLSDAVMARLAGAVPIRPTAPPLVGALLLALDQLGSDVDVDALTRSLARF